MSRTVWRRTVQDQVLNRAAELAFWALIGFFPMLVAVAGLGSLIVCSGGSQAALMSYLAKVLPSNASSLVASVVKQITGDGRAWLALLFALWTSSSAITGLMTTLNVIYRLKEDRAWWRARWIAIVLALATATVLVATVVIVINGPLSLAAALPWSIGDTLWKIAQWPVATVLLTAVLYGLYRFAPNVKGQRWQSLIVGSVFAALLWIVGSVLFKLYVRHVSHFGVLYGSLGTLVTLMFWFYLGGAAILIGGEINSTLEDSLENRDG